MTLRDRCFSLAGIVLSLTLGSCSSGSDAGSSASASTRTVVTLARNASVASAIDCALAKNLLEKQLGLTVNVVDVDEFSQWDKIASGDIDASLEVWPSGHADDIAKYVDGGLVENAGALGPIGRIGWYVPTYLVQAHPELANWMGLQDPSNVALFKDAQSGSKGGTFYGLDPSYTQYDQAIIDSLSLDLRVSFVGTSDPEGAMIAQLSAAYAAKQPLLFYFYTPHPGISAFDLTKVALPPYSDACYAAGASKIACDYPVDTLFKIASLKLAKEVPSAHALLTKLNFSTGDQVSLMNLVDQGKSADEAADSWVSANQSTWQAWLQ
jgi:glycine betaine/proline transport system substrate-binding protein